MEAKKWIFNKTFVLGEEILPIDQSVNRVLAQDVLATLDLPSFRNSAMDGYAMLLPVLNDAHQPDSSDLLQHIEIRPVGLRNSARRVRTTGGGGQSSHVGHRRGVSVRDKGPTDARGGHTSHNSKRNHHQRDHGDGTTLTADSLIVGRSLVVDRNSSQLGDAVSASGPLFSADSTRSA